MFGKRRTYIKWRSKVISRLTWVGIFAKIKIEVRDRCDSHRPSLWDRISEIMWICTCISSLLLLGMVWEGLKCFFLYSATIFLYIFSTWPVQSVVYLVMYTSHIKELSGTGGLDKRRLWWWSDVRQGAICSMSHCSMSKNPAGLNMANTSESQR